MIRFLSDVLEIVRPFGLRRLMLMCGLLLISVVAQMAALFSVLPFLNAAADPVAFRQSTLGQTYLWLIGGGDDIQLLTVAGVVALVLLVAGNLVTLGVDWARGRYAFSVGHQIRIRLISRILERRYEYFLGLNSSTLIKNLVEDVAIFSQAILVPLLDIAARSVLAILLILAIAVLEPLIAFGGAVLVGAYFIAVILPVRRSASRRSEEIKVAIRGIYFEVGQTLSGMKPILANGAQRYFRERCDRASEILARLMPYSVLYPALPRVGLEVLVFGGLIGWVLMALSGGGDLISIAPRVGMIALVAYRLMPSLQIVFGQSMGISVMRQSMDEVLRLLRDQEEHAAGPEGQSLNASAAPLAWNQTLEFRDVTFRYAGSEEPALHGVSFSIARGQHVAFVGPTGSGKSTVIDLILGLLEPTTGEILVDGVPLDEMRRRGWRSTLGYVPQELFLLDTSIAENIAFGQAERELHMPLVREVAVKAQAADFIEGQDRAGYAAAVGERGVRLSGGQRQRLGLARALYRKPSVLVLDEATSALDPETERNVVSAVLEADDAPTIITVAHRLSTVERCDRIFFMQNGRITASGSYSELLERIPDFQRFAR